MTEKIKKEISASIAELGNLYYQGEEDRPERLLSTYASFPEVADALRYLIDALLPGRMIREENIQDIELGDLLSYRLNSAANLLVPAMERSIKFREVGAARTEEEKDTAKGVDPKTESENAFLHFVKELPKIRKDVIEDVRAAYNGDPAALTFAEVKLAYPGLLAIVSHRVAHEFYKLDIPVIPRLMNEWTHSKTGIDIHPGANIGQGFFIDHGTGVVIGETSKIGRNVKLYQGVTLGAKSFPLDDDGRPIKHIQRHPTVEDDVVIYANANILGGNTVIGKGSTIGGNVFLLESVPAGSFVRYEAPELKIK